MTLPAVEVRRVDQELVKTEMPGRLVVISVKHQKQLFVMTRTAQVSFFENFKNSIFFVIFISSNHSFQFILDFELRVNIIY